MVLAPMSDLLQLPQNERLVLSIALWDSLDDEAWDELRRQRDIGMTVEE